MAIVTSKMPPKPPTTPYQTPQWVTLDRKDHVWLHRGRHYVCALCGALTETPPPYPTPTDWMPADIIALTDADRKQAPRKDH